MAEWTFSENEEYWELEDTFPTKQEAIDAGLAYVREENFVNLFVGLVKRVTPSLHIFSDDIVENEASLLDEEAGEMLDSQSGVLSGASRFFYCAKASKKERGEGNNHPTVKPVSLIKYLVTLVTPPNGVCLDPFMGNGTTAIACINMNRNFIGFELDKHYCDIANERIQRAMQDKTTSEKGL